MKLTRTKTAVQILNELASELRDIASELSEIAKSVDATISRLENIKVSVQLSSAEGKQNDSLSP